MEAKKKPSQEEYIRELDIPSCLKEGFNLLVDDIYLVAGGRLTVCGYILGGSVRAGETFQVMKETGIIEGTIDKVDVHCWDRPADGVGYRSEHVALTIGGLKKGDLLPGERILIRNAGKYSCD